MNERAYEMLEIERLAIEANIASMALSNSVLIAGLELRLLEPLHLRAKAMETESLQMHADLTLNMIKITTKQILKEVLERRKGCHQERN